MKKPCLFASVIFCAFLPVSALLYANSIRCGNALIMEDDSADTLLKECGEPTKKEFKTGRWDYWVEYWTYENFNAMVIIDNGKIKEIKYLDQFGRP